MPTFAETCLVDSLAAEVNLECLNPNSQNTYTLADIVTLMNCELSLGIVPLLKRTQQNYFVYNVDIPIIQGQSYYQFPPRAIGNAVRDVVLLDASGNEVALNNLEREYIKVQFPFNFVPSIWSFGMYTSSNGVNLYNTLIQSYTAYKLRFITERRPGVLTLSTNCGQITAITGNVLTLNYVDSDCTTASTFDIIAPMPPFNAVADDVVISHIAGYQVTLATVPAGLAIGQWFCPSMMSCIPQIPYEFFPLLKQMTIATVATGLDMSQLLAASNSKIKDMKDDALALARPRITGSPKVIINKDGMRGFGRGGWR